MADIGILRGDEAILPGLGRQQPENLLAAWRVQMWLRLGALHPPTLWSGKEHVETLPALPMNAADFQCLSDRNSSHRFGTPRDALVVSALDVLAVAQRGERTVNEVVSTVRRYEFLGFEVDLWGIDEDALEDSLARWKEAPRPILSPEPSWLSEEIPALDIAYLSFSWKVPPEDVVHRLALLAPLGVRVTPDTPELLATIGVTEDDLRLLSSSLVGSPPWPSGDVPPAQILLASRHLDIPIPSVVARLRRFERLGIRVGPADANRLAGLDPADVDLLSRSLMPHGTWIELSPSLSHLAEVAKALRTSTGDVLRRWQALAWTGIVLPDIDPAVLDALERDEPHFARLFERLFDPETVLGSLDEL